MAGCFQTSQLLLIFSKIRYLKVDTVLNYFVTHEWSWACDSTQRLLDCMSEEEKRIYE